MDKIIEERDEEYVLMYRWGRKEAGEWQWLDKNKTNAGDRLEGGDDNDEDDDGNVILLNHYATNVIYIYIYIYIYGAPILDVSRSHTTTHHSR